MLDPRRDITLSITPQLEPVMRATSLWYATGANTRQVSWAGISGRRHSAAGAGETVGAPLDQILRLSLRGGLPSPCLGGRARRRPRDRPGPEQRPLPGRQPAAGGLWPPPRHRRARVRRPSLPYPPSLAGALTAASVRYGATKAYPSRLG